MIQLLEIIVFHFIFLIFFVMGRYSWVRIHQWQQICTKFCFKTLSKQVKWFKTSNCTHIGATLCSQGVTIMLSSQNTTITCCGWGTAYEVDRGSALISDVQTEYSFFRNMLKHTQRREEERQKIFVIEATVTEISHDVKWT